MAIAAADNFQLKWHSYGTHLHSSIATLLRSELYTDVCLATIDGRQISAHRFVLSACSSYLQQLLKVVYPPTVNFPIVIVLPSEISYRILKILVQYMYSGEATVSYGQLDGILRAAHILGIKGLCHERTTSSNQVVQDRNGNVPPTRQRLFPLELQNQRKGSTTLNKHESTQGKANSGTGTGKTKESLDTQSNENDVQIIEKCVQSVQNEQVISNKNHVQGENTKETNTQNSSHTAALNPIQLIVKQEPIEWVDTELEEPMEEDLETHLHAEMTIKPEGGFNDSEGRAEDDDEEASTLYAPLTCDLCHETFSLPGDWVRHIETQHEKLEGRRDYHNRSQDSDDGPEFSPLKCELCEQVFDSPGVWVHHIQEAHTDEQLAASNAGSSASRLTRRAPGDRKRCPVCAKAFPSHASMVIHRRTHTGEKPYVCVVCEKGFNVKSNLLRHLRTLHDQIVSPSAVD